MTNFRLLEAAEYPPAVHLWVKVFGVEAEFFQTLLNGGDPDDFSVAAFEDDTLVSSVHVFMRWFRDRAGRPQKVGGIGSVSTLPEHRRAGHSSKLLEMAIEEMAARECVWSYLGTGVNHHYARHGWRTVSTPYFVGTPKPVSDRIEMRSTPVTDSLLEQMARVYDAYSRTRPMSNDRSPAMWVHAVRYRVTRPDNEVFTTFSGSDLAAYLVCTAGQQNIELVEAAGPDDEVQGLVRGRIAAAEANKIILSLPEASPAYEAFKSACSAVKPSEECSWMVRPIADRISLPDLVAIHADPRGRRSSLDNF